MVQSYVNSGCSAATQVKAVSPEPERFRVSPEISIARGQEVLCSETRIVTDAIRRVCNDMPGSQAAAGHSTDSIGTWDSRIACICQQAEEARRVHRDAAVGPAHNRGVAGVIPGEPCTGWYMALEGAGGQSYRAAEVEAIH